jgi:hypothetical protein
VTCGAALTSFSLGDKHRSNVSNAVNWEDSSARPWIERTLQFTARQGAEIVLDAALLRKDDVKPGEFVLPYFYGFSRLIQGGNQTKSIIPHPVKVATSILYEHLFQKMTYKKRYVWICPASVESRNHVNQRRLKERFLKRMFNL